MGAVDASPASTPHEESAFSDGELSTPSVADDVVSEPIDIDSDVSPKSNTSSKGSIAAAPSPARTGYLHTLTTTRPFLRSQMWN